MSRGNQNKLSLFIVQRQPKIERVGGLLGVDGQPYVPQYGNFLVKDHYSDLFLPNCFNTGRPLDRVLESEKRQPLWGAALYQQVPAPVLPDRTKDWLDSLRMAYGMYEEDYMNIFEEESLSKVRPDLPSPNKRCASGHELIMYCGDVCPMCHAVGSYSNAVAKIKKLREDNSKIDTAKKRLTQELESHRNAHLKERRIRMARDVDLRHLKEEVEVKEQRIRDLGAKLNDLYTHKQSQHASMREVAKKCDNLSSQMSEINAALSKKIEDYEKLDKAYCVLVDSYEAEVQVRAGLEADKSRLQDKWDEMNNMLIEAEDEITRLRSKLALRPEPGFQERHEELKSLNDLLVEARGNGLVPYDWAPRCWLRALTTYVDVRFPVAPHSLAALGEDYREQQVSRRKMLQSVLWRVAVYVPLAGGVLHAAGFI